MCSVNGEARPPLAEKAFTEKDHAQETWAYTWKLSDSALKSRDRVEYWAEAEDYNDVTGPGVTKSPPLRFQVEAQEGNAADLLRNVDTLEELLKRAAHHPHQTVGNSPLPDLVTEQDGIRVSAGKLARTLEDTQSLAAPIARRLNDLAAGPMADAVHLLELGRDATDEVVPEDVPIFAPHSWG